MARKSSKTSHVLNLLAGSQEENVIVDKDNPSKEGPDYIEIKKNKSIDDPVADIIRQNLEKNFIDHSPSDENPNSLSPSQATEIAKEPVIDAEAEEVKPLAEDPGYTYINVNETIIKEKVEEFSQSFNMCTCNRCLADITALTLTNLSPKYIVRDSHSVAPLLNYYRNKYQNQITVALTKACMTIKENPNH